MNCMRIRPLACLAGLVFAISGTALAQGGSADNFPNRPIRLTVPYAAGGGTDLVMRAIAPGMGEALGQTVVVETSPAAAPSMQRRQQCGRRPMVTTCSPSAHPST